MTGGGLQEARWGRGSWGKMDQMAGEGGMAGCRRARWQLTGVVGAAGGWQREEFKMGAARNQIRG